VDPDPGSGAFFDLGSRIANPYFDSLMTNFWVKSTIILPVLDKIIFFTCSKIKLFTIL
jgi:hypothetical protein